MGGIKDKSGKQRMHLKDASGGVCQYTIFFLHSQFIYTAVLILLCFGVITLQMRAAKDAAELLAHQCLLFLLGVGKQAQLIISLNN